MLFCSTVTLLCNLKHSIPWLQSTIICELILNKGAKTQALGDLAELAIKQ